MYIFVCYILCIDSVDIQTNNTAWLLWIEPTCANYASDRDWLIKSALIQQSTLSVLYQIDRFGPESKPNLRRRFERYLKILIRYHHCLSSLEVSQKNETGINHTFPWPTCHNRIQVTWSRDMHSIGLFHIDHLERKAIISFWKQKSGLLR